MQDILLVEGNLQDARTALQSFKVHGLVNGIHLASEGPEALDFLLSREALATRSEAQPSLILLSLVLPIIGGLEVLRIIKADPRTRHIPVVVLISSASDLDIQTAMKLQADAVIEKPATFHKLLLVARRLGVSLSHEKHRLSAGDRLAR